ncbi:ATPase [Mangrovibacterium marinum]|uniref:N-acetylglucosamine kinase-like BadF-type ATPase n=1 Tax=Mangrovibacterium marinum TaxID=1639118 RepID=A0A2T5BZH7_9BACT|nr:ATPase [Mangrovibacterium marinum]PTN07685.1 N-acetylglucosamine kinase-like BadF-type ATPase [Mangrovibacterium marinum]
MLLIADSGSTKTDWLVADDFGTTRRFQTSGINPVFRSTEDILAELGSVFKKQHLPVEAVYFYGAGVVNEEKAAVIRRALLTLLGDRPCEIASDVLGAARALCGRSPGIACILGTGANACYYDGQQVVYGIPPMGYILGDEASGAVMGKYLLGDYFKQVMPADLRTKFHQKYGLDKNEVIDRVYRGEKPNKYLASFAIFLNEEREHPYCHAFLHGQFHAFLQRNVLQMPESASLPVSFVGSVAYHFQDILNEELLNLGLNKGLVLKEPIDALFAYHSAEF